MQDQTYVMNQIEPDIYRTFHKSQKSIHSSQDLMGCSIKLAAYLDKKQIFTDMKKLK